MKKFVASYSGGKDSILAIHRAVKMGYEPIQLITTYNVDKERSWFHGIPEELLNSISQSLDIPIRLVKTTGEEYAENFEKCLIEAKKEGAEVCIFGDIDIDEHLQWCRQRCKNADIEAFFPLWHCDRKSLVHEFIDEGYTANITIINTKMLDDRFIGKVLTRDLINEIEIEGADACGENGEYHTFVSDGSLFKRPLEFDFGNMIHENEYTILPVLKK